MSFKHHVHFPVHLASPPVDRLRHADLTYPKVAQLKGLCQDRRSSYDLYWQWDKLSTVSANLRPDVWNDDPMNQLSPRAAAMLLFETSSSCILVSNASDEVYSVVGLTNPTVPSRAAPRFAHGMQTHRVSLGPFGLYDSQLSSQSFRTTAVTESQEVSKHRNSEIFKGARYVTCQ